MKRFNSLSHIPEKEVQFFKSCKKRSIFEKNGFFWGEKKAGSILRVIWKKVQFFESNRRKKGSFFESDFWKGFNSLSHIQKGLNFWIILQKGFNSLSHIVTFKKNQFFSHIQKKIQFFDSSKKGWILWVMSRRLYSLTHTFFKKGSILGVVFFFLKMGSILWVIYFVSKKKFNSLSHIEKGTILWLIFQRKGNNFFETYSKRVQSFWFIFNSMSLFFAKEGFNSLNHIEKKVQFLESFFKKFNSVSHIFCEKFLESYFAKGINSYFESYFYLFKKKKKVQLFESYFFKGSISLSHVEKKGSILWVIF